MRITKSLLFSVLFAFVLGTATASTNPTFKSARNEIKELIVKSDIIDSYSEDVTFNITFMINAKNEIIIMSTDNKDLDQSIKEVLNYKKLKSADMKVNTTYTLPVALKK